MPKRPTVRTPMMCQQLEDRLALSTSSVPPVPMTSINSPPATVPSVSAELHRGTLTIFGTPSADLIKLKNKDSRIEVAGRSFAAWKVKRVVIAAEEGADVVVISSGFRKPCQVFAGSGDDLVMTGRGDDVIYGDGGNDTLYGGGNNDVIYGGDGANALYGGPGNNTIVDQVPTYRSASPSDVAAEVLRLINVERSHSGLQPLAFDARLVGAAELHTGNMAQQSEQTSAADALRHTLSGVAQPTLSSRLDSVGFSARIATENIAYGYDTAAEVVAAWLASPGHRANILSADVNLTGIAVQTNSDGTLFFCQVFAASK